jgi:hypothetical protein
MKRTTLKSTLLFGAMSAALVTTFFLGEATARQPHMRAALDDLQSARDQLQDASSNKGGHRVEALRLTNQAIDEVRSGIEHAEDW